MSTPKPSSQTAAERRAVEAEFNALVARFASAHEPIVAALRKHLRKLLPTAHEVIYEYRSWFVISFSPSDRGYEGVLAIRGDAKGVKLFFNHGKDLPDPEKLLRGSGQARSIDVDDVAILARPAVVRLFEEAIARNPVPFPPSGHGPVTLRSTSAKARTKRKTA